MCWTVYCYLTAEFHDTSYLTLQQDFKQAYAKWFNGLIQVQVVTNSQRHFQHTADHLCHYSLSYFSLKKHKGTSGLVIYSWNPYHGLLTLLCNSENKGVELINFIS